MCWLRGDFRRPERIGKDIASGDAREVGRSSPKRHWPQNAVTAQAATAASNGEPRSRFSTSWDNILALIGGRNGSLEVLGERLWTPFRTKRKGELPFHSMLCARCQAFRAERRLRSVVLACLPRLEAARRTRRLENAGDPGYVLCRRSEHIV